jgi:glucokinase
MADQQTVLGLDLGGSAVKWGVVAPAGELQREGRREVEDRSPEAVADTLAAIVREQLDAGGGELRAVGIGSPGLMDPSNTVVRTSPNFPGWDDIPLARLVQQRAGTELPVVLENDANLLVWSESRWGGAVGLDHVVVLTLGTGVGGGVMTHGRPLRGAGGGAAELGHIPLDINGPLCGCGARGCFEAYCNIEGTMRTAQEVFNPDPVPDNPAALTEAARGGDLRAVETWRRQGLYLGAGIAALVNVFNPQAVLVGGGLSGAGELLLDPAREECRRRAFAPNWEDVRIQWAGLQERAGLFGAAALAFDAAGIQTTFAR